MQFDLQFFFYFLPAFLAVYYLCPKKLRSLVLTAGSLVFYWFASGKDELAMVVLVGLTVIGWLINLLATGSGGRFMSAFGVMFFAATLVFFKLFRGGEFLPVGMSFYVFQLIAYTVDAARSGEPAEDNLIRYFAGITMFPKLLSGPIAESASVQRRLRRGRVPLVTFHMGLQELILGLGLKVLLADRVGMVWGRAVLLGLEGVSTPFAWLALISFCMRLYFDFYGYSLMAVGLGHMLGVQLPMNFLEPYSSRTISEFYRRWHASLGRWFREYIYIPLGGNRRGKARTVLNLAIVWAVTGFWHGIGGGYMVWAGILCLFIVVERLWLRKYLERTRVICHIYTVAVAVITLAAFAAGTWGQTVTFYSRLFGLGIGAATIDDFIYWGRQAAPLMAAGVFFATPIPKKIWLTVRKSRWVDVGLFIVFWACVYFMATSSSDPFMYFKY